jgi:hypothetical protein
MRGDIARLGRCTQISTQGEDTIRRSKPLKYSYEKEIVMYVFVSSTRKASKCDIGMHILRSSIISPPNAYTRQMHIEATQELSSRISK